MKEVKQKSWFSRNWGWLLGGGCLTLIAIFVLIIGGVVYKVADAVTGSEPYTYAFSKAIENEKVITFLGSPIETNGMGSTSYKNANGNKTVALIIPIKGPKDEGIIVVNGEKISNEWSYSSLYVKIDGETEAINLLEVETEAILQDL